MFCNSDSKGLKPIDVAPFSVKTTKVVSNRKLLANVISRDQTSASIAKAVVASISFYTGLCGKLIFLRHYSHLSNFWIPMLLYSYRSQNPLSWKEPWKVKSHPTLLQWTGTYVHTATSSPSNTALLWHITRVNNSYVGCYSWGLALCSPSQMHVQ